ncbi:uncharacterized protein LOC121863813 [Homarus americanus]|uniref:uncharacterized protein LOC121863813 n=1 Tax=Homarus americanus TaxID=6706 RepID=UPI001C453255|nr:uncharacterized protein LOC121863813 [Homarus americanus]
MTQWTMDFDNLTETIGVIVFNLRHNEPLLTLDWQLHIRYVQVRDAGAYECQVSSHPPTSLFVHLEVVEAEAEILGAPEKHVKLGSTLRLVCIMHHTTEALSYVFWYRGNEMINYESEDGWGDYCIVVYVAEGNNYVAEGNNYVAEGNNYVAEEYLCWNIYVAEGNIYVAGSVVVESDDHTSVLMVTSANRHHSGNYTCAPSNTKPASILVHILNEYPAAMQHGESGSPKTIAAPSLVVLVFLLLLLQATVAPSGSWTLPWKVVVSSTSSSWSSSRAVLSGSNWWKVSPTSHSQTQKRMVLRYCREPDQQHRRTTTTTRTATTTTTATTITTRLSTASVNTTAVTASKTASTAVCNSNTEPQTLTIQS